MYKKKKKKKKKKAFIIINKYIYILGELFDYIIAKKRFKEKLARKYFRQIVSALSYLHNSCLIHRGII